MKVSVLGSGAGALSVAAAFSAKGHEVTLADLPAFEENLSPIRKRGGIEVVSEWEASPFFFAVEVGRLRARYCSLIGAYHGRCALLWPFCVSSIQ